MTDHRLDAIKYSMKVSDLFPRLDTITDKLDRQNKIKVEFTSMKNKKNEKNQKINIPCAEAFNPDELADMVTRKLPFMYTKGSKPAVKSKEGVKYHDLCVCVFVHASLIIKAHILKFYGISAYKWNKASCGNYYCELDAVNSNIGELIDLFKSIHNAKWDDDKKIALITTFEDL